MEKMKPTIPPNDVYEMDFAAGGEDPHGKKEKTTTEADERERSKSWKVILLGAVFIICVMLGLWLFVGKTSNNKKYFSENAVYYAVDVDGDGVADPISDYDPSQHDSLSEVVMVHPNGQPEAGALAQILIYANDDKDNLNYPYKNVQLQVTFSNESSNLVYLSGSYIYVTSNGKTSYTYSATITKETYETYVKPITRYVRYQATDTDGNTLWLDYYSLANRNNFQVVMEQTTDWTSWLFPLLLMIVTIGLIAWMFSRMSKGANANANPMSGFVDNVARKTTGSKVRFSDVAGCDEAKAELVEMVDYFHNTDKYTRLGAKLPHGVLLVGPPGTGKTLLAKAVAGEADVPFYSISGSDFVEMYVGVGASRVRSLFKAAKKNAPCLIFIDEIDAVGRQRGTGLGGGNDEREQTLNELLVEMDGFEDNNGIIVMAATNRSDVLDPALTRPGRFDRTITVDLPDKAGRAAILKVHSKNKKLASDVSFENIASRTVGFSGADLANIMNDAAILAVRSNRTAITTADIDEAIDRAIAGPAKRSHLEEHERSQVAYH